MASNNAGFKYEPLNHNGFDIRVLQILPGGEDETITCTLERYVEARGSGWACLSYTWGNESASHEIRLNGSPFLVTPNLHQFLRQARRRNLDLPIWIDAICINQSDHGERNSQVQMMGTIFKNASQVIAWLGPGSASVESAFANLALDLPPGTRRLSTAVAGKAFSNITDAECDALYELCSAAFWTRCWIIQELWLPEHPVIWCGSASLAFRTFTFLTEALADYINVHNHAPSSRLEPEDALEGLSLADGLEVAGKCVCGRSPYPARSRHCYNVQALAVPKGAKVSGLDLPGLLDLFGTSACTDFHDYVYAFRGLLRDGDSLPVSYRLQRDELLTQTLDFVTQTSHYRLIGSSISERHFLWNLCRCLGVGRSELEGLFRSRTTVFLVQVGQAIELGRKTVNAWVFADSITDPADFVNSSWRSETRCDQCRELMEHNIALNELVLYPDPEERQVWLRGLDDDASHDLSCLRAVYEPEKLYNIRHKTRWLLKDFAIRGTSIMALAFDTPGENREVMHPWLDSVVDDFVVMVADSDDAGRALLVSTVRPCEATECLLKKHSWHA